MIDQLDVDIEFEPETVEWVDADEHEPTVQEIAEQFTPLHFC